MRPTTVSIELGGRTRTLRLDLNALCALEDANVDIAQLNAQLVGGKARLTTVRSLVWAFLQTDAEDHDEQISLRQVGKWIDTTNMADAGRAVGKMIAGQRDKPDDDVDSPEDRAGEDANPTAAG